MSEAIEAGARQLAAGRHEAALACFQRVLAAAPNNGEAASLSGLALAHLGRAGEAEAMLRRAIELEPNEIAFQVNLVQGLQQLGRFAPALGEARAVLARDRERGAAALARLARAVSAAGDWRALEAVSEAWAAAAPRDPAPWRLGATGAFEQGFHTRAVELHRQARAREAATAASLAAHGGLCLHALAFEEAASALDAAERLDGECAEMLSYKALLLTYLGRFGEAENYCRRRLARDPEHAPSYTILSQLTHGRLSDAELATVTSLARAPALSLADRAAASFAAGHAHDARGDVDAAFAHYEQAHALCLERDRREGRGYNPTEMEGRVARVTALFPPVSPTIAPRAGPRPIFIIGMPRSGTTLIESVLSAHPRVAACGESPTMGQILDAALALGVAPDAARAAGWARDYIACLPPFAAAEHVTDKHPLNFWAVGLIALLFPDAPIVHVRRAPMECALSIFAQEFNKHWRFVHRLADIAHYWRMYEKLMAHWRVGYGARLIEVSYEDFAGDFAKSAPALVAACGLEWNEACADFQQAARPIATFSTVQARGPVRARTGRAAAYQRQLEPLAAALKAAGAI